MNDLVGRRRELAQINYFMHSNPAYPKLVCLHGAGGIGKTAILRALKRKYEVHPSYLTTNVIDLVEARLSKLRSLRSHLADQLDPECEFFSDYYKAVNDYDYELRTSHDIEAIRDRHYRVEIEFLRAFRAVAGDRHVIVFLDTMEAITLYEREWKEYNIPFLSKLPMTSFIVAGREVNQWRPLLNQYLIGFYELALPISGLTRADADRYFELAPVGRQITGTLREKIYLLTNGRPILIDLAIEWLRRELPFKSLKLVSSDSLRSVLEAPEQQGTTALQLHGGQTVVLETLIHQFEYELIENILELPGRYKLPILAMACLHESADDWLLKNIIDHFMPGSADGDTIVKELGEFTFIKTLPNKRLMLHDEAQRMIREYELWGRYDGTGEIRKELIQFLANQLGLRANEDEAQLVEILESSGSSYAQIEQVGQDLTRLRYQQLDFALQLDIEAGYQQFLSLFTGSRHLRLFLLSESLIDVILKYEKYLTSEQNSYVQLVRAQYYFDSTAYERAEETIHNQLAKSDVPLSIKISLLSLRGNIETRRGRGVLQAQKFYEQALNLCRENNLKELQPKLLSELGYLQRSQGNLREAIRYYELARNMAVEIGDQAEEISILIRWSIVDSRVRSFPSAYEKLARVRKYLDSLSLPDRELVGRYYSALGENLRYERRYNEAIEAYDNALQQFTDPKDQAWPGVILSQRGIAYLNQFIADPSKKEAAAYAHTDLLSARDKCKDANKNALPTVLHRLGRYYQAVKDYERAIRVYLDGAQLSRLQEDSEFVVEHLVSLSEVLSYKWRTSNDELLVKEIENHKREIDDLAKKRFRYPHLYGKLLQILGNIFLIQGRYDDALELYISSIPRLREQEMFVERDRLDNRLREIEDLVLAMPVQKQHDWWCQIYEAAMSNGFDTDVEVTKYLLGKCNSQDATAV